MWHINSSGDPGSCRAHSGACPFGGESKHFRTRNEALQSYEDSHNSEIYRVASKSSIPDLRDGKIRSTNNSLALSKKEFNEASSELSNVLTSDDWNYLMQTVDTLVGEAYRDFNNEQQNREKAAKMVINVFNYLSSDQENAEKLRGFLGDEVDLHDLSEILVREVGGMVKLEEFHNGKPYSAYRGLLTATSNDMTKKRYFASVLFFGGRCCYCNKVLKKKNDFANNPGNSRSGNWAEGEHIDPLSPEDGENKTYGETRFGNMALACSACNREKMNLSLDGWIGKTTSLSKNQKDLCKKRISAFREYTLYEHSSSERNLVLEAGIQKIKNTLESAEKIQSRTYSSRDAHRIKLEILATIQETRNRLHSQTFG